MAWFSALGPVRPWMRSVSKDSAKADALAGFTNAAIVLPQGVAFATIAGLPPEYGLYSALIVPVIAAVWGASMIMISGPTTAISAIMFATLSQFAPAGTPDYINIALVLTVMVGLVQLVAGLARLGGLVSYVSHSVLTGFTTAAAILIAVSQLASVLGLQVERGGSVVERVRKVADNIDQLNTTALTIALVTLGTTILINRISKRIPGILIALITGTAAGYFLHAGDEGVAVVGDIPSILPVFNAPDFSVQMVGDLLPGAVAIALIGLLEAISISRTFAIRRNETLDTNQEVVGQGLSNLVGGFFQAYAGSGSFTRSGVNAESGARTPLSAVFAAAFLLLMLLVVAPLFQYVPMPAIGGIILYVAWKLIDFKEIGHFITTSKGETATFALTMLTGLFSDLDFAIFVGVITSLSIFIYRTSQARIIVMSPVLMGGHRKFMNAERYELSECPQISVARLNGQLYFGSVDHVDKEFRRHEIRVKGQNIRILALIGVGDIDLSGANLLIKEIRAVREAGGDFHLIATWPPLLRKLEKLKVIKVLGQGHLHRSKREAMGAAVGLARDDICAQCHLRLYYECEGKPAPADMQGRNGVPSLEDLMQVRDWTGMS